MNNDFNSGVCNRNHFNVNRVLQTIKTFQGKPYRHSCFFEAGFLDGAFCRGDLFNSYYGEIKESQGNEFDQRHKDPREAYYKGYELGLAISEHLMYEISQRYPSDFD